MSSVLLKGMPGLVSRVDLLIAQSRVFRCIVGRPGLAAESRNQSHFLQKQSRKRRSKVVYSSVEWET